MTDNKSYKLYYGALQSLPDTVKYSYYEPKKRRVLIYSDRKHKGFYKVTPKIASDLTADERRWLIKTKSKINIEYMRENEDVIVPVLQEFLDKLEQELKTEAKNAKTLKVKET